MAHLQALTRLRMYTEAKAEQQARQVERKVEVVRLPEDLQGEVEKLAQEEGISVKLAARILKAERAVQAKANATETDEERTARLKAKRDATPATISRAVTADEAGARSMTRADYNRRLSEFDEADDIRGKMAFVKKKQEGKIKLRD
jgi:DNA polymerase II small subunit/DNA polymerase delta subunit B